MNITTYQESWPWLKRIKFQHGVIFLFGIAILLRLNHYLGNRPLRNDEAFIALNVLDRSYLGLLQPLDWGQIAPIGYLAVLEFLTRLYGGSEYVLRLFPFVAGVASVFLFYHLAKTISGRWAAVIGLALFALADEPIYYAAEVKQYSSDVAIALLLYVTASLFLKKQDLRNFALLVFTGAVAIWFSHPSAFILAGIGITFSIASLIKRDWRNVLLISVAAIVWLISFSINLFMTHYPESETVSTMTDMWEPFFVPFPPASAEDIDWYLSLFFGVFLDPGGFRQSGLAAFLYLVGAFSLWRDNKVWLSLFVLPVLVTLGVSALNLYPFGGRVLLFLVPGILIVMAVGIDFLRHALWKRYFAVWVTLVSLLMLYPVAIVVGHAVQDPPYKRAELPSVLSYVAKAKACGDSLYVEYFALPAFEYYAKRYGLNGVATIKAEFLVRGHWDDYLNRVKALQGSGRVWVILQHPSDRDVLLYLFDKLGKRLDWIEATTAWAYLYDFGPTNDEGTVCF